MVRMLKVCEQYAEKHNLRFSTDPIPSKSKSKCLYMCGHLDAVYPLPLQLCGQALPWVQHAVHLGHELHQLCSMEFDANIKRAEFIDAAADIQETFKFATPNDIIRAVQVYAGHFYGGMLWDLFGEKVGQIYRSWNTSVKIAWGLPRSTHTFLVENFLARDFNTVKQQLVGRFVNFFQNLLASDSPEVRIAASIVGRCARSTTGRNLKNIEIETGTDPWILPGWKVRQSVKKVEIPSGEVWRAPYMVKLLESKKELDLMNLDTSEVSSLLDSLCSS